MDQHMDSVMVLTSVARIEVMVGRPVLVALHNIISIESPPLPII